MARLCVRVKDNLRAGHPAPALAYRPGDVVSVHPDGHRFGRREGPPNFAIVDVLGVTVVEMQRYIAMAGLDGPSPQRRMYALDLDGIPARPLEWTEVRTRIRKKATGEDESRREIGDARPPRDGGR